MPNWLVWVATTLGAAIIGAFGKWLFDYIKNITKKGAAAAKAKRQGEVREVIQDELTSVKSDITNLKDGLELNNKSSASIVRETMHLIYEKCIAKGYVDRSDRIRWKNQKLIYNALGGNDHAETVDFWEDELNKLEQR